MHAENYANKLAAKCKIDARDPPALHTEGFINDNLIMILSLNQTKFF